MESGAAAGSATVTATFRTEGSGTRVEVATDLDLTGRPAQLGAGAISSASNRLADQFIGCIGAKLGAGLTADTPGAEPSDTAGSGNAERTEQQATGTGAAAQPTSTGGAPSRPGYAYRPPSTSQSAPHLQVLPDVARTWLPWVGGAVGGLAVLALVIGWLRRG